MSTKNMFIVEDETASAEILINTLNNLGYQVTGIAATGVDAVEKISINNYQF